MEEPPQNIVIQIRTYFSRFTVSLSVKWHTIHFDPYDDPMFIPMDIEDDYNPGNDISLDYSGYAEDEHGYLVEYRFSEHWPNSFKRKVVLRFKKLLENHIRTRGNITIQFR